MAEAVLLLGDCRERLQAVETESVDLIVTSPPYANQRSNTYGGIKPDEYVEWFLPIADQLYRVLKPSGTFILNIKEPAVKGERHTCVIELVLEMRKRGWLWTEEFVWHKKNSYPGKWPNRFRGFLGAAVPVQQATQVQDESRSCHGAGRRLVR